MFFTTAAYKRTPSIKIECIFKKFNYRLVTLITFFIFSLSVGANGPEPCDLTYIEAGDPTNEKAIVLLHGFPQFSYMWHDHMELLKSEYFVVAPDMRGYGQSCTPTKENQYEFKFLIADIENLILHQLQRKKVVLVGHDWGGLVAHAISIHKPELVEKVVFINAPHPLTWKREILDNKTQRRQLDYIMTLRSQSLKSPGAGGSIDTVSALMAGDFSLLTANFFNADNYDIGFKFFDQKDREAYKAQWTRKTLLGGINYYRANKLGPPDFFENSERAPLVTATSLPVNLNYLGDGKRPETYFLKMPALYLWGLQDKNLLSGFLDDLETTVGGENPRLINVRSFNDASHWLPNEKPCEVSSLIRSFVDSENNMTLTEDLFKDHASCNSAL